MRKINFLWAFGLYLSSYYVISTCKVLPYLLSDKYVQQEMDSLQETAREQLVNLAAQGENAVGVAQAQLMNAHKLVEQFQLFVKVYKRIYIEDI